MIFNLISKNNGVNGAVIKNNGTEVFTPVVGTIYSCTKDLLPKSAGVNDFYYVQEDNSLLVGQGGRKPLKEITGIIISNSAGVNLNDYVTKDTLADNLDTVTNNIKALIPDITEYMKSVDIQAALNTKADASSVYSKTEVDALIDAIKAGTADLDLYLTKADADTTYLKKTDAVTTAAVQAMIDGAGHVTNADIAGFLDKDTADTLYQPAGTYLDKATADTLYQPIGTSSGGLDADTVQNMIDNAGHLTAADVATMQADIDAAKADASAAKTAAEQAAQNAQDAKTKAESVETIANDAKTKAESAEAKADAAKTTAETAKTTAEAAQSSVDNINTYLASDEFKAILEKQMQDIFASSVENPGSGESGSGQGSGSGSSAGGSSTGGSTGTVTPGTKTTFSVQAQNNGSIDLSSLGIKFTEDQILNNKIHFYVMPDSTAIGSYVQTNHPEGLEIPISFDGETEETVAYDKIWSDNSLENPGYIVSFDTSNGDDSNGFDVLGMSSYTISAGWTLGILIDA